MAKNKDIKKKEIRKQKKEGTKKIKLENKRRFRRQQRRENGKGRVKINI
jgi:hypothetical protein